MGKFEVGSRVIVNGTEKGTIMKIFEGLYTALVDMEDEDPRKVAFNEMELDPGENEETARRGIVIDADEFQRLAYDVGIEEADGDLNLVYHLGRYAGKLHEILFSGRP